MSLNPEEIQAILGALQEAEWDQAVVVVDDVTISVSRNGAAAATLPSAGSPAASAHILPEPPAPAPVSPTALTSHPAPAETADGEVRVTAPSVGVVWRAPEPGAAPFVTLGQHVEAGDTLCIVEVMKLMNNVTAGVAGTVTQVLAENGQNVEFGSVLFTIRED